MIRLTRGRSTRTAWVSATPERRQQVRNNGLEIFRAGCHYAIEQAEAGNPVRALMTLDLQVALLRDLVAFGAITAHEADNLAEPLQTYATRLKADAPANTN